MICTENKVSIYYAEIPKTINGKEIKKPFCDYENKFLGYIDDCKCKKSLLNLSSYSDVNVDNTAKNTKKLGSKQWN